jgi:hypothetical protein
LQKELNSDATGWTFSNSTRLFLPGNWKFNYEIDKTINSGFASNVNTDPLIINATLEKGLKNKMHPSNYRLLIF